MFFHFIGQGAVRCVNTGTADNIVAPALHAVILLFKDAGIAGDFVHGHRHRHGSITPTGTAHGTAASGLLPHLNAGIVVDRHIRNRKGNRAVFALVHTQGLQPLGQKRRDILIQQGGFGIQRDVTGPSCLFALGTVGGNGQHIRTLAPARVLV